MSKRTPQAQIDAIHARIFAGMVEGGHILVGELHPAGEGEIGGIIGAAFAPIPQIFVADHPQIGLPVIVLPRPGKTAIAVCAPLDKLRVFGRGLALIGMPERGGRA